MELGYLFGGSVLIIDFIFDANIGLMDLILLLDFGFEISILESKLELEIDLGLGL